MKRLTMWYDGNQAICEDETCVSDCCPFADPVCDRVQLIIDRLAAIEDILGDDYDLDRLRELVEADREKRCVILPKDMSVYFLAESISSGEQWVDRWPVKDVFFKCGFGLASLSYSVQDIGNKIYLTRKAAEAALKAREQDG